MRTSSLFTFVLAAFGLLLTACTVDPVEPSVNYQIVDQRDVPVPVVHHTRYDVVLEADALPEEADLRATAMHVWRTHETSSNKMIVRMYLPEMDLAGDAYATATVTKYGVRDVRVNPDALANTPWNVTISVDQPDRDA